MAMTKKEKEALENALTSAALRATSPVKPDIPIPGPGEVSEGWEALFDRVGIAWSRSCAHGRGPHKKEDKRLSASQGGIALYSTKTLALKAIRYQTECRAAKELRRIDIMIEQAEGEQND